MFDHEDIVLHWVNRLGFLVRKELTARFRDAGFNVTTEEWAILLILWRDEAQTPGDIARRSFRDPTTVTRLVDGMVRKGLVERRADCRDRRRSHIACTQSGTDLQGQLVPVASQMITQALDGIGRDDIETTLRTLRAMTGNLAKAGMSGKGKE